MGVSENPVWLDSRLTSGKAFDGTWSTALASVRDVKEPATGQVLSQVGIASAADMRAAIDRAHAAQPAWAAMGPRERSAVFHRAAAVFQQHFAELALTITRETGSILPKGQHEVTESITLCHLAAGLPMQAQGQVLPSAPGRLSFARRVPHGVVGVISPFNFPLILSLRAVAPALALGNAVVLKPDTRTPVSGGFIIARVFEEAGLPKGVLQVLPGDAEAGEALVTDPRVPMIAFTGSPTVGRRIGALAGEHLKKVSLELGGANNLIVLEDADLDAAASAAAFGAWFHQGQICMASNRILVHESIAEGFKARMVGKATHLPVGDGASGQVALGPLIDAKQLKHFDDVIQDSVKQGAVLEAGGTYEGLCYKPTVLSGVKPGIRSFDEEPFGPVVNLITFRTDDEAVQLANTSQGGLAAAVISPSIGRALAIGQRLRAGMVHINDQTVCDECTNPFGGPGIGGNGGSVGGPADIDEYTQWQWITVKDAPPAFPF
ncbi:MAG: benzaldehyde dehydrogenase [Gammaproteobacteria bacterium]|uniref:benzaldehyde dehydrogenase n=1 Tax=Hydrogenophaga sp. TaxID=1904254 RepID=UPI0025C09CF3|nr:benzaldehyde dehydrogenase [Hydrogenophaga sp.]MBU4181786.1 benzaldehyde dehydrogenase [Gammaproteobacteria bacterium]MBU4279322.1 benzaldehyde dehydrogenase [Gammaproteobacteria bacterium]MBU4326060.1 benzaldehyde dehydrogenase [Gammaproteobacteria bacterium]MBU4506638.1 benzaldehyde dehydrogenase [Gammaproteobacteria bacterium]MCG2655980.1 benzaldehyde dehydrogenase [Hydrogenophaga sp.]